MSQDPTTLAATALYAGDPAERGVWATALREAAAEAGLALSLHLDPDEVAPENVQYLLFAPGGAVDDLSVFPRLRAILSLWAGVEQILARDDLPEKTPITRMVEPGLAQGMTDYVVGHVLRVHLDIEGCLARSAAGRWDKAYPPLSTRRRVGVLGLGALGMEAARALRAIGFDVAGWSRSRKGPGDGLPEGVEAASGIEELDDFLARSDILVVLLPLTAQTDGLLDARRLAALPEGAHVINAARGAILPEADLLQALGPAGDAGRLGGATLDVFETEPLPPDHAFWAHPRVLVTPHVASVTRPETASLEIIRQIVRDQRGQSLRHLVDRTLGY